MCEPSASFLYRIATQTRTANNATQYSVAVQLTMLKVSKIIGKVSAGSPMGVVRDWLGTHSLVHDVEPQNKGVAVADKIVNTHRF